MNRYDFGSFFFHRIYLRIFILPFGSGQVAKFGAASVRNLRFRRNAWIYNSYGYSVLEVEKECGTMDGKIEKKKYNIDITENLHKKHRAMICISKSVQTLGFNHNARTNNKVY